jgi:uncharacterized protein YjbI with pentapeptide repeats
MMTDPDREPTIPRNSASRFAPLLLLVWPLLVLLAVAWLNGRGSWPAFRHQDTSVLHWILAGNQGALRSLGQSDKDNASGYGLLRFLIQQLDDYLTLENINLSGLDLTASDLSGMSMENVSFAGAQLVNAKLSCTDLTNVDFSGAKLMNSRFDYSDCGSHLSTRRPRCRTRDLNTIQKAQLPYTTPLEKAVTCLEVRLVGADFSDAFIRGDQGRADLFNEKPCAKLLLLVGDMSGVNFSGAKLTCVAFIHRPSPAPSDSSNEWPANISTNRSFNNISFKDARLDRVALLKGPFRFSHFERADLMGLFINVNQDMVDLNYSRFNEIICKFPKDSTSKKPIVRYFPCLLVQQDLRLAPLNLNFLWSTLITNLKPISNDRFLCTPPTDLPAVIEKKRIESSNYWLTPAVAPVQTADQLKCPAASGNTDLSHVLSQSIMTPPAQP